MESLSELLRDVAVRSVGRCARCKKEFGRDKKENLNLLRCPECDFPFGEIYEAVRAISFALQERKRMVNVYSQPVCYVWLKVVKNFMDLSVEPADVDDEIGGYPEWLEHGLDQISWSDIISPSWCSRWEEADFDGTWNNWALEEGLCPGQTFLVEMKPPRWYRCSYEYEEYDVEYTWDIVRKSLRSPKQAARAWEVWIRQCKDDRVARRKQAAAAKRKREHDVSAMFLRYDYSSDGGYIVALCSKHVGGGWLLQGRTASASPSNPGPGAGGHERAFDNLIEQVQKYLPHLDPAVVRKLGRSR